MKKVIRILCVVVVCLCLLRNLFGVVEINDGKPNMGIDTGFDIEAKFERFAESEVFDYNNELIELQTMQWYFESAVAQGSAKQGDWYATYQVLSPEETPDSDGDVPVELWDTVKDTNGNIVYNVWRSSFQKGSYSWFAEFGNFVSSIVGLVASVFRLIGVFLFSMIQTIAELAKLAIDIVFLP